MENFVLERAFLVLGIENSAILTDPVSNPQPLRRLTCVVNDPSDLRKGAVIVAFSNCVFVVDETLPNGTWYDPDTQTFGWHSPQHRDWQLNDWGIKPIHTA